MAEILTKEKEFIKINEELDKLAAAPKIDNKFHTFQKSKGPSTLLRKQGAGGGGDGYKQISDSMNCKDFRRAEAGDTYRVNNWQNNEYARTSSQPGESLMAASTAHHRFIPSRYADVNRAQRTSSSRSSSSQSPSLELLVKEESSSLHCQDDAVHMGSVSSMPTDEGTSSARHSQSSYHTVSSKKNVSSEGLIKFLKSKIVILEEDHERISQEMAQQKELFEKTLEHTKALEQQRDQAKNKNNSLSEQLAKSEKQLEDANRLLKERSIQQNAQSKELETAKRELKLLTQKNVNLEKRLFRANEDLENVRKAMTDLKTNERERREVARRDAETKDTQIKSLKKQRANLLNAYKKQLFLIDNLKRQNILLEQAKMLDIGEKEFVKVLDWDIKK